MACCGDCVRLYKAKKFAKLSWYIGNVFCSKCGVFIRRNGMKKPNKTYQCKCCGGPIRHTPYSGRKSLAANKVIIEGIIPNGIPNEEQKIRR